MGKIDNEKLFDYNKHNLVYISDYIKLADQKASVLLTVNIALIGFIFNFLKKSDLNINIINKVFIILGVISLIISGSIIILKIIWPRYNLDANHYMSWAGISAHSNEDIYIDKVVNKEFTDFVQDMLKQNFDLAIVCKAKYKFLKISTWFFIIGLLVTGIAWLLDK
ncbi:hypothetical protein [Priestia koreensis]|uniref:Pycsar effector protein domain-containing protein n=1 Tax=Priestia koreensis TaxID=284581 RepID=A0A0M0KWU4_9BACI|nr:hypothetical protein [Priestia koreensis]KOO43082.1 hypothetical protein AMD01_16165 [Priestia koreensis]